jgi:hypothetical protein
MDPAWHPQAAGWFEVEICRVNRQTWNLYQSALL